MMSSNSTELTEDPGTTNADELHDDMSQLASEEKQQTVQAQVIVPTPNEGDDVDEHEPPPKGDSEEGALEEDPATKDEQQTSTIGPNALLHQGIAKNLQHQQMSTTA